MLLRVDPIVNVDEPEWRVLGARDILRVDFMIDAATQTPMFLEANSIPGFTATSLVPKAAAVAGLSFDTLCSQLVDGAFRD